MVGVAKRVSAAFGAARVVNRAAQRKVLTEGQSVLYKYDAYSSRKEIICCLVYS